MTLEQFLAGALFVYLVGTGSALLIDASRKNRRNKQPRPTSTGRPPVQPDPTANKPSTASLWTAARQARQDPAEQRRQADIARYEIRAHQKKSK